MAVRLEPLVRPIQALIPSPLLEQHTRANEMI
jgi:hypothetical protein